MYKELLEMDNCQSSESIPINEASPSLVRNKTRIDTSQIYMNHTFYHGRNLSIYEINML